MRRKLRLGCLTLVALVILGAGALAALNAREAARRDRPYDEPLMTAADKAELAEAKYLEGRLGDEVWPGIGHADIPIILFNDRYEFLVAMGQEAGQPPEPWALVEGDSFYGQPYHRRDAGRSQAFAVPVGSLQAGSIGSLDRMNRDYFLGVRRQLPPVLAQLFPYQFATLSRDMHVVAVLHEAFHAYQATQNPTRFQRAKNVYTVEKRYPYEDGAFASAWDREGAILSAALKAESHNVARGLAREFLAIRNTRRTSAGLAEDLIAFERELEWLEGLAKHVEIRFYELAASQLGDPKLAAYRPGLPYWQMEFGRLDGQLGQQEGDFRFYLSGMAQARLLDRLMPGWQNEAMTGGVHVETLLEFAAQSDR